MSVDADAGDRASGRGACRAVRTRARAGGRGSPAARGRRRAGPRTPADRRGVGAAGQPGVAHPHDSPDGAGGGRAGPGGLRRPVPPQPAPAAARRPGDREHQRQRLRPGLGPLRRRPPRAGRADRRLRRGAGGDAAHRGGPHRDRRAPLRPRLAPALPPAARRVPAVRAHGGGGPAVPVDPPPPLPADHPRRPGRHGHHRPGAARVLSGRPWSARKSLHHLRRHRGGQDHPAAGHGSRHPTSGAAGHHRGLPRAGPRPLPRPASRRRGAWRHARPTWKARAGSAWPSWSAGRCA